MKTTIQTKIITVAMGAFMGLIAIAATPTYAAENTAPKFNDQELNRYAPGYCVPHSRGRVYIVCY